MNYDIIIVGGGPGGYVAAIRAAQLGMKTALVERAEVGGICLNWGCIPTKALLKSAQVFDYLNHAADFGIQMSGTPSADLSAMVKRSRDVAEGMSKGVQYLLRKNKVDVIRGNAVLRPKHQVLVTAPGGETALYGAKHIVIAVGARSRELDNLKQDGKKVIGYREAMTLSERPNRMVVVGSGAIGLEFAYFYGALGTEVTLVEMQPAIAPLEDEDVSRQLERSLNKAGIKTLSSATVLGVESGPSGCTVRVSCKGVESAIGCDVVLSAVGVQANLENLGLEEVGIATEKGRITVDRWYQTTVAGYHAIGDCIPTHALAHVASAEGITCVEKIAGVAAEPIDYMNIPACTYCQPEVASVGYTEKAARAAGFDVKVGKFPFSASGKAKAGGHSDGFIKMIFDAKYGALLGAHLIGANVTEMIAEVVVARKLETTAHEIIKSIHPHPTMSEALMEAAAAAYDEVIHL